MWLKDFSRKVGILGQGFKPLMGSLHVVSHSPLRPIIPGLLVKTIRLVKRQDTWDWIL
jgi:hypothetical protein